jgi:hypothetical protein
LCRGPESMFATLWGLIVGCMHLFFILAFRLG